MVVGPACSNNSFEQGTLTAKNTAASSANRMDLTLLPVIFCPLFKMQHLYILILYDLHCAESRAFKRFGVFSCRTEPGISEKSGK